MVVLGVVVVFMVVENLGMATLVVWFFGTGFCGLLDSELQSHWLSLLQLSVSHLH